MTRTPLLVLAACASLAVVATPVLAQSHVRKVSPDSLSSYWVRTNTHVYATAPNRGHGLDKIGCAAVSYLIGADGKTRHVKVRKVVPSTSDFQLIASSMIDAFHYAPASGNPHDIPVATYFIVPFNVPSGDKATMQRMLKTCQLPGYSD